MTAWGIAQCSVSPIGYAARLCRRSEFSGLTVGANVCPAAILRLNVGPIKMGPKR